MLSFCLLFSCVTFFYSLYTVNKTSFLCNAANFDVFDAKVRKTLKGPLNFASGGNIIITAVAACCNTEIS